MPQLVAFKGYGTSECPPPNLVNGQRLISSFGYGSNVLVVAVVQHQGPAGASYGLYLPIPDVVDQVDWLRRDPPLVKTPDVIAVPHDPRPPLVIGRPAHLPGLSGPATKTPDQVVPTATPPPLVVRRHAPVVPLKDPGALEPPATTPPPAIVTPHDWLEAADPPLKAPGPGVAPPPAPPAVQTPAVPDLPDPPPTRIDGVAPDPILTDPDAAGTLEEPWHKAPGAFPRSLTTHRAGVLLPNTLPGERFPTRTVPPPPADPPGRRSADNAPLTVAETVYDWALDWWRYEDAQAQLGAQNPLPAPGPLRLPPELAWGRANAERIALPAAWGAVYRQAATELRRVIARTDGPPAAWIAALARVDRLARRPRGADSSAVVRQLRAARPAAARPNPKLEQRLAEHLVLPPPPATGPDAPQSGTVARYVYDWAIQAAARERGGERAPALRFPPELAWRLMRNDRSSESAAWSQLYTAAAAELDRLGANTPGAPGAWRTARRACLEEAAKA